MSEQNGDTNAFTVAAENGEYMAVDHEALVLANGDPFVKSIQRHDDYGAPVNVAVQQVAGLVVTGTPDNPMLYVSSSDPRVVSSGELFLDTNSGAITRLTWNGKEWEADDGTRESVDGIDVAGPWGGNDKFNMAILPDDAPIRIFADGFRSALDVVLTEAGQFFTVANGSNNNLGGDPIADQFGAPTQLPNNGGIGAPAPLFLVQE